MKFFGLRISVHAQVHSRNRLLRKWNQARAAATKALLQSGVAYVGGYQGAPVSHLLDVMVQAKDYMQELGVHVEACANEASAAAMLGASIHYP